MINSIIFIFLPFFPWNYYEVHNNWIYKIDLLLWFTKTDQSQYKSIHMFLNPIDICTDASKSFWFFTANDLWVPRNQTDQWILINQWSASIAMSNSTLTIARKCTQRFKIIDFCEFVHSTAAFLVRHCFHLQRLQYLFIVLEIKKEIHFNVMK